MLPSPTGHPEQVAGSGMHDEPQAQAPLVDVSQGIELALSPHLSFPPAVTETPLSDTSSARRMSLTVGGWRIG